MRDRVTGTVTSVELQRIFSRRSGCQSGDNSKRDEGEETHNGCDRAWEVQKTIWRDMIVGGMKTLMSREVVEEDEEHPSRFRASLLFMYRRVGLLDPLPRSATLAYCAVIIT